MYSYIWDKVDRKDFINLNSNDDFQSSNIYSELFLINIKKVLSRGLYKEYVEKNECLNSIKGKIDLKDTISKQTLINGKIYCDYDDFEENNIYNQILKSTAIKLYKSSNLSKSNKKKLNNVILYFNNVDYIDINMNTFKKLKFNKMNHYYYFIIKICELINTNQMLNEESGKYEFTNIFEDDSSMNSVFELFIYKFYQYELKNYGYKVKYQSQIKWQTSGGDESLLPIMKMDTEIISKTETIIIDTKYYKNYLDLDQFGKKTLKSANMYQMNSYLNNVNATNNLRGILLYPLSYGENGVDEKYNINVVSNNEVKPSSIEFKTIDLSEDWKKIYYNLLNIVNHELAIKKTNEFN